MDLETNLSDIKGFNNKFDIASNGAAWERAPSLKQVKISSTRNAFGKHIIQEAV